MTDVSSFGAGRDIAPAIRQTAELRRLCLWLREAANRDAEETSLSTFREALTTSANLTRLPLNALRAGFRSLRCQGRYAEIVAVAQKLSEDLLAADETVLMYALCAARRAGPLLRTPAA